MVHYFLKPIVWNRQAKQFVRSLSKETRIEIGVLLMLLQQGRVLGMPQSRPMRTIHKHAFELRLRDSSGAHRVIYVLVHDNAIVIPHAFMKKSERTPDKEIETARKRLQELLP